MAALEARAQTPAGAQRLQLLASAVAAVPALAAVSGFASTPAAPLAHGSAQPSRPTLQLQRQPRFCHAELIGRLGQLSGVGALTLAVELLLDAQRHGEPVAWVCSGDGLFYPPDLDAAGVDFAAMVVVRAADAARAASAGDRLLRSGGFGLLVLDLGADAAASAALQQGVEVVPLPLQARLVKLAQHHEAAVLVLTGEKVPARPRALPPGQEAAPAPSLSSLVSWRATCRRQRVGDANGKLQRFACSLEIGKDKRRGPGGRVEWAFRLVG